MPTTPGLIRRRYGTCSCLSGGTKHCQACSVVRRNVKFDVIDRQPEATDSYIVCRYIVCRYIVCCYIVCRYIVCLRVASSVY